jgi:hypothetical protein
MKQLITRLNIEDKSRTIEFGHISGKGVKYRLLKRAEFYTGIFLGEDAHLGFITLAKEGWLYIDPGYEWNGGNFILDRDEIMRGSLFHDALCELLARGILNDIHIPKIHDIFTHICRMDGLTGWVASFYRRRLRSAWN